jgi:hypothetical protein
MKIDREMDEILGEIGREHRGTNAPPRIEAALRAETTRRQSRSGLRTLSPAWGWAFALLLLAAIASSATVWELHRIHGSSQDRQPQSAQTGPAHSSPVPAPPVVADFVPPPTPVNRKNGVHTLPTHAQNAAVDRAAPHASQSRSVGDSLQEFVPLPVSEGLPPAAQLSVVRVKLRGTDLQQYGLQPPADAVAENLLAEFVVGEDGLPRAIRIVQ